MKHEYKNLGIWKRAREINKRTYSLSRQFSTDERFGLKDQIRRSSVSVVSNIAEGTGFDSDKQLIKYLYISLGSLCELETQFYVAYDLDYIRKDQLENILEQTLELKKMTIGLIKKIKNDNRFNLPFLMMTFIFSLIILLKN